MEAIPHLFEIIGWIPLLIVNELYYVDMIYEFYANLHKGRIERVDNVPHQWILTRIGEKDIAFDDRLLNEILDTPQDGIRVYTKNKKCFDPNLYSERRFEEIFTRREDMDVEEEDSDEETEVEVQRRETRQKKQQERTEEGSSSGSMSHLMDMIASLRTSLTLGLMHSTVALRFWMGKSPTFKKGLMHWIKK
ncbi:hypothetical protein M9H77_35025 [Catharanthus roseus]|uniref:Uncharacterized protein n=1 Tax=Catharanthus roseus TaxID=4058 RepID=A0ACB9ZNK8_CATRO|nr:hypothetical protein M9H77_35025 [Catharanthus roseus]